MVHLDRFSLSGTFVYAVVVALEQPREVGRSYSSCVPSKHSYAVFLLHELNVTMNLHDVG